MVSGQAGRDTGRLGAEALAPTARSKLDDLVVAQEGSSSIGGLSAPKSSARAVTERLERCWCACARAGRRLTVSEHRAPMAAMSPRFCVCGGRRRRLWFRHGARFDVASSVRPGDVEEMRRGAGARPGVDEEALAASPLRRPQGKDEEERVPHESRPAPPANVRVAGSFDGSVSADFAHEPDRFAGAADWRPSLGGGAPRDVETRCLGVAAVFRSGEIAQEGVRGGRKTRKMRLWMRLRLPIWWTAPLASRLSE